MQYATQQSHEVDYEIFGDDMQIVEVELDPAETVIAEAGAMNYMEDGIQFETKMGDGSKPISGVMDTLLNVGKRVLTGESIGGELTCQKDAFLCAAYGTSIDIAFQKKLGTGFFGGEGLFLATLRGPGKVYLQSLPFSRLANRVIQASGISIGGSKGEGSVLGGLGDLFGDR